MGEKRSVEFEGVSTGDGSCACFEVDEETFRRVNGERRWEIEKKARKRWGEEGEPWRVYPPFGLAEDGQKCWVRMEIEVLKLEDG